MKTMTVAALIFFGLLTQNVLAGSNAENGGDGVLRDHKVYSLDLVEYGLELSPYLEPGSQTANSWIITKVDEKLQDVSLEVRQQLARKLTRIAYAYPFLWSPISGVLENYEWLFLNVPMQYTHDSNTAINLGTTIRIANHDGAYIRVDRNAFALMPASNQTALLLHEMVYASFADVWSDRSRMINAFLFNKKYSADTLALREYIRKLSGLLGDGNDVNSFSNQAEWLAVASFRDGFSFEEFWQASTPISNTDFTGMLQRQIFDEFRDDDDKVLIENVSLFKWSQEVRWNKNSAGVWRAYDPCIGSVCVMENQLRSYHGTRYFDAGARSFELLRGQYLKDDLTEYVKDSTVPWIQFDLNESGTLRAQSVSPNGDEVVIEIRKANIAPDVIHYIQKESRKVSGVTRVKYSLLWARE